MKKIIKITVFVALAFLAGCASLFGDKNKTVQVNSSPQGAMVFANNKPVGVTPVAVPIYSTWSPTLLTIQKKGYVNQVAQVNTTFQPIGILNILFWPGFVVDAATGNMMKVAPESRIIYTNLSKN